MKAFTVASLLVCQLFVGCDDGGNVSPLGDGDILYAKRTSRKGSCAVNNGGCDANATCTQVKRNQVSCSCKAGFQGDGLACTPVSTCTTNFDFEGGDLTGWNFSKSDAGFGAASIVTDQASSGSRSVRVPVIQGGQFRMLRQICLGSTFDLAGRTVSFWVRGEGVLVTESWHGCEGVAIAADGTYFQITPRRPWAEGAWTRTASSELAWSGVVQSLGIYCVVNAGAAPGALYFDDIRVE